jgi:hypothetical protein
MAVAAREGGVAAGSEAVEAAAEGVATTARWGTEEGPAWWVTVAATGRGAGEEAFPVVAGGVGTASVLPLLLGLGVVARVGAARFLPVIAAVSVTAETEATGVAAFADERVERLLKASGFFWVLGLEAAGALVVAVVGVDGCDVVDAGAAEREGVRSGVDSVRSDVEGSASVRTVETVGATAPSWAICSRRWRASCCSTSGGSWRSISAGSLVPARTVARLPMPILTMSLRMSPPCFGARCLAPDSMVCTDALVSLLPLADLSCFLDGIC